MPIYKFFCEKCQKDFDRFATLEDYKSEKVECRVCTSKLAKKRSIPTIAIKEVIDNGIMGRKVEQFANSQELVNERAYQHEVDKNKNEL